MRKIFLILFVLISYCSFGQFPNNVTTGSPGTGVLTRGRASIDSLLQINTTCFTDTTAANRGRIEEVGGAMIRTCDDVIWLRNVAATRWVSIATGDSRLDSLNFLNDTTLVVCYEDGSCDTIGINNFNTVVNTLIQNFNDSTIFNFNDSTLIICYSDGSCDTIDLRNSFTYYFLNDSTLVTCDTTETLCVGDSCYTQQLCDTIPLSAPIRVTVYQNGVRKLPNSNIVQHGKAGAGEGQGQLIEDTWLFTRGQQYTISGTSIARPPLIVQQSQWVSESPSIIGFNHYGDYPNTGLVDSANRVNLYLNYTNPFDEDTIGFMYDRIGYMWMTNARGSRYAFAIDNTVSKQTGILFHTLDTAYDDGVTIFAQEVPSSYNFANNPPTDSTLLSKRVAVFKTNQQVQFPEYIDDNFADASPTYGLGVDSDGNVVMYPPGGGGILAGANDGLSVTSTIVKLGQSIGAVGNPAILLSHREIPLANFTLNFNADAAQSNNMTVWNNSSAAIRARITSAAAFSNTGGQSGSEIFGDGVTISGTNSVVMGNGASVANNEEVVIGHLASGGAVGNTVVIGKSASSTIGGSVVIGSGAAATTTSSASIVGQNAASSGGGSGIGYSIILNGVFSVGIGNQANVATGHEYSQAYGTLATTTAANQLVYGAATAATGGINDMYVGRGVTSTENGDLNFQTTGGSGTNRAGGTLYINGAKATGNAAGGTIIFQTSTAGGSGTTLQSLASKIQINGSGILAYDGVMPTSGAAGDSVVHRRTSDGQFYLKPVTGGTTYTFTNGLTESGGTVKLGGTLVDATTTIAMGGNIFQMTNIGDVQFLVDATNSLYTLGNTGGNAWRMNIDDVTQFANIGASSGTQIHIGDNDDLFTVKIAGSTYISVHDGDLYQIGDIDAGTGNETVFIVNDASQVFQFKNTGNTLVTVSSTALTTFGTAGTIRGSIALTGNTSGTVTIQPAAAAGTYTLTLPTDDGGVNQVLTSDGSGVLSWTTPAGTGDVTKVGTPVNNQLGVWTGDGTIEGDANLTFASSTLNIGVAGASTGILTVSGVTSGTVTIQPASVAGTYTLTLPANDGDADQFLQTNGSGVLVWAAGGGSSTWNGITNPTGDQALTFDAGESSTWTDANTTEDLFTVNSSTGTTNSMFSLNRTGTALAAGNNIMELVSSGANGTNAITATGLSISVTNTNATSGTNKALVLTASGATTANYAIEVTAGQVILPNGSSSLPSIYFPTQGTGIAAGTTFAGIAIHANTITRAELGQSGLAFRENTALIDIGNAALGGTNRFRITAPAVGTMQLGMESTQQSMIFKGANNAGTNAAGFNMTLQPGAGTGTSTSAGTLIFQTPDETGSGTTVQSFTTKFTIGRYGGVWASRNAEVQGADVASVAGAIAVGNDGNAFEITGTNAITLISNVNWQNGAVITFIFTSTASLTDGTANSGTDIGMELAGNANFTGSAGATLSLRLLEVGGTQRWYEIARSVQ